MTASQRPRRAWWLVDGLAYWILESAVRCAPERLPAFGRVLKNRQVARLTPLSPNCQTPPSLASLYSGCSSGETGLCGFDQPDFTGGQRLASIPAFRRGPNPLAFVWELDREDRGVRFLHVPFVSDRIWAAASHAIFGFDAPRLNPGVLSLPEARALFGEAVGRLTHDRWSELPVSSTNDARARTRARLHEVDGRPVVMVLGHWEPRQRGTGPIVDAAFMATGLQHQYRKGQLGPTLMQGGEGVAEAVFIDSLRQLGTHFSMLWLRSFQHPSRDDIYGYQPVLDLALHELAGFVAPDCRHSTFTRAQVVWPLLIDLLSDLDVVLGATLAAAGPDDRILITSDHGMMPVDTLVRPNMVLHELNVLHRLSNGNIDTERSLVWLHPAENGLICVNKTLCAAHQKSPEAILADLCSRLSQLTGRQASVLTCLAIEQSLSPPDDLMARYFISTGRYTQFRADFSGEVVAPTQKTGEHLVACQDPTLDGVVIDPTWGHCFAAGRRMRTTEVAAHLTKRVATAEQSQALAP